MQQRAGDPTECRIRTGKCGPKACVTLCGGKGWSGLVGSGISRRAENLTRAERLLKWKVVCETPTNGALAIEGAGPEVDLPA